jgi:hypothetical protein
MLEKYLIGALGLAVALIGGHVCARFVVWKFGKGSTARPDNSWRIIFILDHIHWTPKSKQGTTEGAAENWAGQPPQWLLGMCERLFFTIVVGFSGVGVGAGTIIAWLAIKTALDWRRRTSEEPNELRDIIRASQLSNLAGLISLLFAMIGGLILSVAVSPTLPVRLVQ